MQIHIALCISAEKYLYHVTEQKVHKHVELFMTNANHTSHFAFQMNQYSVLCDRASRNVELGKKYIIFLISLVYVIYPFHKLHRLHHGQTSKLPNWLRILNKLFDQVFISSGTQFEHYERVLKMAPALETKEIQILTSVVKKLHISKH